MSCSCDPCDKDHFCWQCKSWGQCHNEGCSEHIECTKLWEAERIERYNRPIGEIAEKKHICTIVSDQYIVDKEKK